MPARTAPADRAEDLAFVGAGLRTTTFLAAQPDLVGEGTCIVEASGQLGPGLFGDLCGRSNSSGRSFFRHVDIDRSPLGLGDDPLIAAVAGDDAPVDLAGLARALARTGDAVRAAMPADSVLLRRRVLSVKVRQAEDFPVRLTLSDGEVVVARRCVLGTGRTERMHPSLAPLGDRTWLSARVLSRGAESALADRLLNAGGRPVVILGCSHSAFSCLERVLSIGSDLRREGSGYDPPPIHILHRRDVRLRYESVAHARRAHVPGRDARPDPAHHVCPRTGIVFRDTGLRGSARALHCAMWQGDLPHVYLHRVPTLDASLPLLEEASLIVQALGYAGRTPPITVDGRPLPTNRRLDVDHEGILRLPHGRRTPLAAIRVDPTPRHLRDSGAYAQDLPEHLGRRLRAARRTASGVSH